MREDSLAPESVLIIQTGFLGDAVLATGMVRALSRYPEVRIGVLVRHSVTGIFRSHPAIHRVHAFDKRVTGVDAIAGELRDCRYESAAIPHRSFRSAFIARRAGIPLRVGFDVADAPWLYTHQAQYLIADHELERNARLVGRVTGSTPPPQSIASWLIPDEQIADRFSRAYGLSSVVLLAPGSVWPTKRWTPSGYISLAKELRRMGERVILVGSPDERADCKKIADAVGMGDEDVLAGTTNPEELVALCSVARRVFTNDSAALHVAESVGTPVTAIFGPTVPEFGFGPRLAGSVSLGVQDLSCRPCRIHGSDRCPIGTHECMTRITPEEAVRTIRH